MSFYEDGFYNLEEKVNIEDLALPNDPPASNKFKDAKKKFHSGLFFKSTLSVLSCTWTGRII